MKTLPGRIVIDPPVCGRGTHIKAMCAPNVVLKMLANQEPRDDIHADYPALNRDNIRAAIEYARNIASIPRQSPALVPV